MSNYVRPKKNLGQHFLTDKNIAAKIAESSLYRGDILEIGPGKGMLTGFLYPIHSDLLKVVEVDEESVEYLRLNQVIPENQIIYDDFLKSDLRNMFSGDFALTGNLPYNISSPVFFKIIELKERIPEAVFMIQKEVAERICSIHGNKTYGILSVMLQAFYQTEYLFTVSEKVFNPPPKVKSAVIRLTRKENHQISCPTDQLIKVVKTAFNQRRKTLSNSLKPLLNGKSLPEMYCGQRAEQLSVQQFIELTNIIFE